MKREISKNERVRFFLVENGEKHILYWQYWKANGEYFAQLMKQIEGGSIPLVKRKIPRWLYVLAHGVESDFLFSSILGENGRKWGKLHFLTQKIEGR